MSLLMDALRRAETSKQETARSLSSKESLLSNDELSLEPLSQLRARPNANPLPDLAEHIDAVDAELTHTASATSERTNTSTTQASEPKKVLTDQAAIRNSFVVKNHEHSTRNTFWIILGGLAIVGASIAAYFTYQVLRIGKNSLATYPTPTAIASPLPTATVQTAVAPLPLPPSVLQPLSNNNENDIPSLQARPHQNPAPDPATEKPIRLTRTKSEVDTHQLQGYAHIERNELDFARRDYEKSLLRDPNNIDSLIALGSIAQYQGRASDAERFFQRAIIANPADPVAQAAILNGNAANIDPQNTESRIKTLLSSQPESAPLNFALGNLYARQGRWTEAQQYYFNSVAGEVDNPDYLFNLAISLDHMRQERLAVQHYKLALEASEKRPSAFDKAALRKRLNQLEP